MSPRALLPALVVLVVAGVVTYVAFAATSKTVDERSSDPASLRVPWIDPDGVAPIVGSLDVNPADDSLWLATNTGLWRLKSGADKPERVTGRLNTPQGSGRISEQLVVRFDGPDSALASGHPPAASTLPRALGLIESRDAGRTWSSISQLGRGDFHALQLSGDVIVGASFGEAAVNISRDGGKTFETRVTPAPLVDLAVDPEDAQRWIASTQDGLIVSDDEGHGWREREPVPNVRFTWPARDSLYRIDPGGPVKFSSDGGRTWQDRGTTGGEPQALFANTPDHLDAVLIDGTVKESQDGGATWTDRVTPPA
jgi:photosystem II stability/assembly factor-like uncharacterized protein